MQKTLFVTLYNRWHIFARRRGATITAAASESKEDLTSPRTCRPAASCCPGESASGFCTCRDPHSRSVGEEYRCAFGVFPFWLRPGRRSTTVDQRKHILLLLVILSNKTLSYPSIYETHSTGSLLRT